MRANPVRVLGILIVGAAVATTTACIPGVGGNNKAACDTIKAELSAIPSRASGLMSNPTQMAQVYTDAANKIRTEGSNASGDVQSAATQVASDLDSLANTLRQAASGNVQMPDSGSLISSSAKLQAACNS